MGIVGIIVNCALIGQSGQVHRMFPNITSTQTIILIVILEVSSVFKQSIQCCQLATTTVTVHGFYFLYEAAILAIGQ